MIRYEKLQRNIVWENTTGQNQVCAEICNCNWMSPLWWLDFFPWYFVKFVWYIQWLLWPFYMKWGKRRLWIMIILFIKMSCNSEMYSFCISIITIIIVLNYQPYFMNIDYLWYIKKVSNILYRLLNHPILDFGLA